MCSEFSVGPFWDPAKVQLRRWGCFGPLKHLWGTSSAPVWVHVCTTRPSLQGLEVSPSFSAIVPNTSLWDKLRQVPTLPLTLRGPQHSMFIRGQLVALNILDTEIHPSAATCPFPSPWGHGGERRAWAHRMLTEKFSPCKVLKHSWSKCWCWGLHFPWSSGIIWLSLHQAEG